ncbi:MAG: hypothetical protein K1X68_05700 [Saprospiraceae bacterium]|nr:hypothetical protein [Saprospiraceae bacterium]HMW39233.1 hypothetical protein [Saprospiraceae bacterium]HMX88951.1 hypothetical protein [Saprospiraceae bacterium]HMZ40158.1 hypothetical protein [Saprospiraceae bacterium]HNA64910.1 hypothetical protein [Saprospiraceae bacterium]
MPSFLLYRRVLCVVVTIIGFCSCRVLENASRHDFHSGYYRLKDNGTKLKTYVQVDQDQISIFSINQGRISEKSIMDIQTHDDKFELNPNLQFDRTGLDVDLTSILMKYRMARQGRPAQISTDLNLAIYAGWRKDRFGISSVKSPIHRNTLGFYHWGVDAGPFIGLGTTSVNSFSTLGRVLEEYGGLSLQGGVALFAETSFASFGLSIGIDHLTGRDRNEWIYQNKPWLGFVVGVALN